MQNLEIQSFKVIGLSIRTTNANMKALKDIGALWGKYMAENISDKIPNKIDGTIYSIYTDYESDQHGFYTTILGCKVEDLSEVPEGMVGKEFGGGKYAMTSAKGDVTKGIVGNKWGEIWEMDLDRTYTADFEVYGEKAMNPQDAEVDFFVAVK